MIATTPKFYLILRHEWLQAKTRLLPCTQVIAHTYYIMSHQELA